MTDSDHRRLDRRLDWIERELPDSFGRKLRWLRDPSARRWRVPAGVLLMIGGMLGFLPILGFWMFPVGLVLLAQDVPMLKRPTGRALVRLERLWKGGKRRWRR